MRTHTQAFKEQIKVLGREIDSRITYGSNIITSEELFSVSPVVNGSILKSSMKQLDFESSVQLPLNTVLEYQFGLKVNGKYEYLSYGNFIVYSIEYNEDMKSWSYVCYDSMLFTMKEYTKLQNGTFPMTVREYLTNLCLDCGLVFKNANDEFANYDKVMSNDLYANLGYTYRDILDELSQVTASTICSDDNNQVEIRYITETNDSIDEEYLKAINVKFGEKYGPINSIVLSRSAESDNVYLQDEDSVASNGLCELKIIDNQIMNDNNRSDYLPDILEKLNGLEYFTNDYSSTGILYYELCDRYNVQIGGNTYSCVLFNDEPKITQGLIENIYTELPNESQTDYTKSDKTDRKINQTYLIVDKQNQVIQSVVEQTDVQTQKINKVTQTVEELNSKISDIADITTSNENTNAKVELSNINQSEPIRLVIRPIGENISYLYPNSKLFPSSKLFLKTRTVRFANTKTNENFDYVLPANLLYYDEENYDEFILDYDGQSCVVNKRVGYNADGTTYVLDNPKTVEYEYPKIELTDGDYTVSILGYDSAYIFVRLMAQNIYTTQFYTKAEVNSEVSQMANKINSEIDQKFSNYSTTTEMNNKITQEITGTENKINLEVSKKVNNEDYTSAQILMKINNDTSSTVIKSDKLDVDAIATFTNNKLANAGSTVINGSNITTGTLSADRLNGGSITASTISLKGVSLTPTTSKIAGMTIEDGTISNSRMKLDTASGILNVFNSVGGSMILSNAARLCATAGVGIYSNSNGNLSAPSKNIDLKACNEAEVYLGCMETVDALNELSSVNCKNSQLVLKSAGTIYANGSAIGGSSSKNTKTNIKELSQEKKNELYELIKDIPLFEYDYKPKYGKEINYGFLIEDIENTKLNDLLHIVKVNEDIKTYCSEDLTRLNLIMIKELIKKVETLENKIKELESDKQ